MAINLEKLYMLKKYIAFINNLKHKNIIGKMHIKIVDKCIAKK